MPWLTPVPEITGSKQMEIERIQIIGRNRTVSSKAGVNLHARGLKYDTFGEDDNQK